MRDKTNEYIFNLPAEAGFDSNDDEIFDVTPSVVPEDYEITSLYSRTLASVDDTYERQIFSPVSKVKAFNPNNDLERSNLAGNESAADIITEEIIKLINDKDFKSRDFDGYLKSIFTSSNSNVDSVPLSNSDKINIIKGLNIDIEDLRNFYSTSKRYTPWRELKRSPKSEIVHENFKHPVEFANCRNFLDVLRNDFNSTWGNHGSSASNVKISKLPEPVKKIQKIIDDADKHIITAATAVNKIYAILLIEASKVKSEQPASTDKEYKFYQDCKRFFEQSEAAHSARIFGSLIIERFAKAKTRQRLDKKNNTSISNVYNIVREDINTLSDKNKAIKNIVDTKIRNVEDDEGKSHEQKIIDGKKIMGGQESINLIEEGTKKVLNEKPKGLFHRYSANDRALCEDFTDCVEYYETKQTLINLYKLISETCFEEGFVVHGMMGGTKITIDKFVRNSSDQLELEEGAEECFLVPDHVAKMLSEIIKAFENKISYKQALSNIYYGILVKGVHATQEKAVKHSKRDHETTIFYQHCQSYIETYHRDSLAKQTLSVIEATMIRKYITHSSDDNSVASTCRLVYKGQNYNVPKFVQEIMETLGSDKTHVEQLQSAYKILLDNLDNFCFRGKGPKAYNDCLQFKALIEKAHPGIVSNMLSKANLVTLNSSVPTIYPTNN